MLQNSLRPPAAINKDRGAFTAPLSLRLDALHLALSRRFKERRGEGKAKGYEIVRAKREVSER